MPRELIEPQKGDKRYVRRGTKGKFSPPPRVFHATGTFKGPKTPRLFFRAAVKRK
jgi:hypothetical protein